MKSPSRYSRINGIGAIIFFGCMLAAAYYGATDAPRHIQTRVLLIGVFGALLTGRDDDEGWFSYLFWGALMAMLTIGLVVTISRWIALIFES
jgi:hypothetical protein